MDTPETVPTSEFTHRSFATAELPEEKVEAIRRSRMDARHTHLDKMLDAK
jgi:hypothetical protein